MLLVRSMFPDRYAGPEAPLLAWVRMAVGAWRLVGLSSGVIGLGLVISFWYMGYGIALVLLGCVVPIWFARQLESRPTAAFAAGIAFYGLSLGVWLLLVADLGVGARVVGALAAFIPGIISAVASKARCRTPI